LTSSILVYLIGHYQLTYDQGGMLISFQAAGSILSSIGSGPLSLLIGRRRSLFLAASTFTLGAGLIALLPPLPLLQLALFLTGFSWGISNNLVNFLVIRAGTGESNKILVVHMSFTVGAFIAPLLVAFTVKAGLTWRWPAALIALAGLGMFVLASLMPIPESSRTASEKKRLPLAFFRSRRFYLYVLMLFLYVGIETGISSWLVTYLTEVRQVGAADAQTLLSALWLAMISGRLLIYFFGKKAKPSRILLLETAVCGCAVLLLALARQPAPIITAVLLLGLSMAVIYSMVIANAAWLVTQSTVASGVLMSAGGMGASVMPYLAGLIAERCGIMVGIWALAATAGGLFLLALLNALFPRK
jgi:fucose permease